MFIAMCLSFVYSLLFFPVVVSESINWVNLMKILGCDMLSFFFFMFGIGGIRAFFDELKYME